MMTHDGKIRILAIGGGGCTHGKDPDLEGFALSLIASHRPRVGFVGTADESGEAKRRGFNARFADVAVVAPLLPVDADRAATALWAAELDLVYIGGGSTAHLLERWRRSGQSLGLLDAARKGTLVVGISAGAVSWFDFALSDSGGAGLAPVAGLGAVSGSCCPHYSDEPARRPAYVAAVASGVMPTGIAIDDGAAALCENGVAVRAVTGRPGSWVYRVTRGADGRAVASPFER
jgi:peptidase E